MPFLLVNTNSLQLKLKLSSLIPDSVPLTVNPPLTLSSMLLFPLSLAGLPKISRFRFASLSLWVWHKATSRCRIISVSLRFFVRLSAVRRLRVQTTYNIAFSASPLWVVWDKARAQNVVKSSYCPMFVSRWSTARDKPCYFMHILIWGAVRRKPIYIYIINFLLIWILTILCCAYF